MQRESTVSFVDKDLRRVDVVVSMTEDSAQLSIAIEQGSPIVVKLPSGAFERIRHAFVMLAAPVVSEAEVQPLLISDMGNTQNPALRVLLEMRYSVCGVDGSGFSAGKFRATKGGLHLQADTLTSLLGLASIYDRYGADWETANDQILLAELPLCDRKSTNFRE